MVNRSADRTESVRLTADEQAAARGALGDGWTLPLVFRAAARALANSAARARLLRLLKPFRPEPGQVGRPRKRQTDV